MSIHWKNSHMMKPLVPKFCPDLWAHLQDIVKKLVPAKLKPIVGAEPQENFGLEEAFGIGKDQDK